MNEIRLNLEDILRAELENEIMFRLESIAKEHEIRRIVFWHNGGVDDAQIQMFKEKIQPLYNFCSHIKITKNRPNEEFVWFDVLNYSFAKNNHTQCNRFSYVYQKLSDIIKGIDNFKSVIKFVESGHGKKVIYKKENNNNESCDNRES